MPKRSIGAYARNLLVESLAKEGLRKSYRTFVGELEQIRPGSFPLVSADSFRALSNIRVENGSVTRNPALFDHDVVYLDMLLFERPLGSTVSGFENLRDDFDRMEGTQSAVLIIANADVPPSMEELAEFQTQFRHVYCANVLQETPSLTAIPVGVENLYRFRNGRLRDFLAGGAVERGRSKNRIVLGYFNIDTNVAVREPLAQALKRSRFGWSGKRLSPETYREAVRESLFVLSPPGNGTDCHRTWEAIYLGAVPVVLRGTLAPSLAQSLPILEVDSFSDFISLTDNDMRDLAMTVLNRSVARAYMPYWVGEIGRHSS